MIEKCKGCQYAKEFTYTGKEQTVTCLFRLFNPDDGRSCVKHDKEVKKIRLSDETAIEYLQKGAKNECTD